MTKPMKSKITHGNLQKLKIFYIGNKKNAIIYTIYYKSLQTSNILQLPKQIISRYTF